MLGDANNNGIVDVEDLNIVGKNWLKTDKTYSEGDFDGDGIVGIADLEIIGTNWLSTIATVTAVPEPSGMLNWIWLLLVFRRRKSAQPCR